MEKKILFFFFLVFISYSCQTFRKIENLKPRTKVPDHVGMISSNELDKLIIGDRLKVLAGEREYYMHYRYFNDDELKGILWKDPFSGKSLGRKKQYEMTIPVNEINELRVYRVNWGLTVGGVFGFSAFGYLLYTNMDLGFALYD